MMRALWTGASGMTSQQNNLDTISNNFANVNTAGYKKEQTQFSSLLYQKLQTKTTDAQGNPKPVISQVGSGVRTSGVVSVFSQGPLLESDNDWDLAVEGKGFFMIRDAKGETSYTRNGSFRLAMASTGVTLANTDGFSVLDSNGQPIVFDSTLDATKVEIDEYGNLMYPDENDTMQLMNIQVGLAQFNNPSGLEKSGQSLYYATESSGDPRLEAQDTALNISKIHAGRLEGSNVDSANEIVNLIVAQRAYEMNSKTITAADEMLQQANNLRG